MHPTLPQREARLDCYTRAAARLQLIQILVSPQIRQLENAAGLKA
jgi:hypothetical protein